MDRTAAIAQGRVARSASAVLVAAIAEGIIGFLFIPVVVRFLGPAAYGDYATVLALFGIAQVFTNLGLFSAIRKSMGDVTGKRRQATAAGGLLLSGLLGATATGIGLAITLVPDLPDPLGRLRFPMALMAGALLTWNIYQGGRSVLFGLHREHQAEPVRILASLVASGLGILLLYLGFGIPGLFVGIFAANGVAAVVVIVLVRTWEPLGWPAARSGLTHGRGMISFGIYTTIGMLFAQLLYYADLLLISAMRNPYDAGVYKSALVLSELLWIIPGALQVSLLHNVAELWAKKKLKELGALLDRSLESALLITIFGSIGLLVLARPIIVLYFGPEFAGAVHPVQVLTGGAAFFAIARILNPFVEATGRIRANVAVSGVIAGINVGANLLVIPHYGLWGAAWVSGLTYAGKLGQLAALASGTGIPIGRSVRWGRFGAWGALQVIAGLSGEWVAGRLGGSDGMILGIAGLAILVAAGGGGLAFGLFSVKAVRSLLRMMVHGNDR